MLSFEPFTHLSFDCYGTLIDWESGILDAVSPALRDQGVELSDADILSRYAYWEAELESDDPFRTYREILCGVWENMVREAGLTMESSAPTLIVDSLPKWRPFPDTIDALARLASRFKLVILSNVDDDLFAETSESLPVDFAAVITAEQVGSYKPSLDNFRFALSRLGIESGQLLHVAQSIYHDHVPAKQLGWSTVRINRASARPGVGVAPSATAQPDLEVPDLASLADRAGV